MKVKELIELLQKANPDAHVIVANGMEEQEINSLYSAGLVIDDQDINNESPIIYIDLLVWGKVK